MKRPNKNDYPMCQTDYYLKGYYEDLEKYCDFLEEENMCFGEVYSDSVKFERALDKACEELEFKHKEISELHNCYDENSYVKKEQWKEWCMEDE